MVALAAMLKIYFELFLLNQKGKWLKLLWKYWGDFKIKSSQNHSDWKSKIDAILKINIELIPLDQMASWLKLIW